MPDHNLDFGSMPHPDFITKFHAVGESRTTREGDNVHEVVVDETEGVEDGGKDDDDDGDDSSDEDTSGDGEGSDSSDGSD